MAVDIGILDVEVIEDVVVLTVLEVVVVKTKKNFWEKYLKNSE